MQIRTVLASLLLFPLLGCQPPTSEEPAQTVESSVSANPDAISVLVLGAYHFDNPGRDVNNLDAEDVRAPARQAELEVLAEEIAAFRPTAIAIERVAPPPYIDNGYASFTPEALAEDRDERVQLAYRIAHNTGINRVYAIDEQPADDEPDYFPFDTVQAFVEEAGQQDRLREFADLSEQLLAFAEAQKTATIPELLLMVNSPEFGESFYWDIIRLGEGENQPGAELAAYWFMRNAKIFNKLDQVAQPGDRILVVYGAGHGYWLNEITARTTDYRVEPLAPYLERATARLNPTRQPN